MGTRSRSSSWARSALRVARTWPKALSSGPSGRAGSRGSPSRTSISAFASPRTRTATSTRCASCRRALPRIRRPSRLLPRPPSPRRRLPLTLLPRPPLRRIPCLLRSPLPSSRGSRARLGRSGFPGPGTWWRTGAASSWLIEGSSRHCCEARRRLAHGRSALCFPPGPTGTRSSAHWPTPARRLCRSTHAVGVLIGPGHCFPLCW
jgi:hypothetical protein